MTGELPTKRTPPTADEEWAAAERFFPGITAPKSDTMIVARNSHGEVAHVIWETHMLEPEEQPYWARMDTLTPFEIEQWTRSAWTPTEILEQYS